MQMSVNLQTMATTLQTLTCVVQDLVQTTQTLMSVYEENNFRCGEKVSVPVNNEKSPVNDESSNNTVDFSNDEDNGPLSTIFIHAELIEQGKNRTSQNTNFLNVFFFSLQQGAPVLYLRSPTLYRYKQNRFNFGKR